MPSKLIFECVMCIFSLSYLLCLLQNEVLIRSLVGCYNYCIILSTSYSFFIRYDFFCKILNIHHRIWWLHSQYIFKILNTFFSAKKRKQRKIFLQEKCINLSYKWKRHFEQYNSNLFAVREESTWNVTSR